MNVVIPIALLHFVTRSHYRGLYSGFINCYLLDILIPFGFYFLLCLNEFSLLRPWIVKNILLFGVASFVEIAQFFGAPILGRTFDPVDYIMYEIGVILAAILDITVFSRILTFWVSFACNYSHIFSRNDSSH